MLAVPLEPTFDSPRSYCLLAKQELGLETYSIQVCFYAVFRLRSVDILLKSDDFLLKNVDFLNDEFRRRWLLMLIALSSWACATPAPPSPLRNRSPRSYLRDCLCPSAVANRKRRPWTSGSSWRNTSPRSFRLQIVASTERKDYEYIATQDTPSKATCVKKCRPHLRATSPKLQLFNGNFGLLWPYFAPRHLAFQ